MNEITIAELLPHPGPMLLLDRLLDYQEPECAARPGSVSATACCWTRRGNLPAWVGLELMAQTIAAWAGMRGQGARSRCASACCSAAGSTSVGCRASRTGERLVIEAECLLEDGGMSFECRILCGDLPCAEARLSTYLPGDEALSTLLG